MRKTISALAIVALIALSGCGSDAAPADTDGSPSAAVSGSVDDPDGDSDTPGADDGFTADAPDWLSDEPEGVNNAGSLDAPLAAGTEFELGPWTLTVTDTDTDALATLQAASDIPLEEPDGHSYVIADVSVAAGGDREATSPWLELTHEFISADGNKYNGDENDCGTAGPYGFAEVDELATGESASTGICLAIPEGETADGIWRIRYFDADTMDFSYAYVTAK